MLITTKLYIVRNSRVFFSFKFMDTYKPLRFLWHESIQLYINNLKNNVETYCSTTLYYVLTKVTKKYKS